MTWEEAQKKLSGQQQASSGWQQMQKKITMAQNGGGNASDGWLAFQERLTGQSRTASNAQAYQASGMDALRKDASALRDSLGSYFENEHKANRTNLRYRAKANEMLSAISKERDYFQRYADAFTQEDLQKYNAELDEYEAQLRTLSGYFGNGSGTAASKENTIWGSGYATLSKELAAFDDSARNAVSGRLTTEKEKNALLAQRQTLSDDLEATKRYFRKNRSFFSEEEQETWEKEFQSYRDYLDSMGAYLSGNTSGVKNPLTGKTVQAPMQSFQKQKESPVELFEQRQNILLDKYMPTQEGTENRVGRAYGEICGELTKAYDELYNLQNQVGQYKDPDRSSLPENYANEHLLKYAEDENEKLQQKLTQAQEKFDRLAEEAAVVGAYSYNKAIADSANASDELTSGEGAADWYFDGNKGREYLYSGFGNDAEYYATQEGKQKLIYAFLNDPKVQNDVFNTMLTGGSTPLGIDLEEWDLLTQLSDRERRAYNYLYNQKGATEAEQFLDVLLNGSIDGSVSSLAQRQAEEIAQSWNKPVLRALYSGTVGLDTVFRDLGATITGQTRDVTPAELAVSKMREDSGTWGKSVIGASGSFGRMLPAMAVSAVTGMPLAGSITTGITSGASAYQEGMRSVMEGGKGFSSPWQGLAYGVGSGISEAALQEIAGGIPGLKGVLPSAVGDKLASAVSSGIGRAAIKYGTSMVSEVLEEEAQNYLEPLLVSIVTGRKYDAPSVQELVDTALSTLLLTGVTNAATFPNSAAHENAEIFEAEQAFAEAAMSFPEGSDIYLAGKVVADSLKKGEMLTGTQFRSLLQNTVSDESVVQKIRNGKFTQEDAKALRLKDTEAAYTDAGMSAELVTSAAEIAYKVKNGEDVNNSDIRKLRLNTEAGAQGLSSVLGVEVSKAENNNKAANKVFRDAEFAYRVKQNAELYGKAELDVRKLPSTQESADAILSNEQAKADFQKLFGVTLKGDYAKQSAQIIEQLDYWWMANYKTQEQESASQQVERWNAEQTTQNAADVQQNAANVQRDVEDAVPYGTQQNVDISNDAQFHMVDYDDTTTQKQLTEQTHAQMVEQGRIVEIESNDEVASHYPDLRAVKKQERNAILQEKISALKNNLRAFMKSLKVNTYQFDVNGNILEARIYDTGIKEVTEKLTEAKANMLLQSDEIFKNAQYLYSTADKQGDSDVYRWNYFYTPVKIGNDILGVRIAVRDVKRDNSSQIYHWGIKNDQTLGVAKRANKRGPGGTSSVWSGDSISQESEVVNSKNGESVGAARSGFDPYSHAANEYGTIEPGENPARVVDVPKSMDGTSRVSKVARTAMEAEATADGTVEKLEQAVTDGLFSYDPVTNEQRRAKSEEWFSYFSNTETAFDAWRDSVGGKNARMSIDAYSNGIYLYAELNANAKGADNDTMREHYEQQAVSVLATLQDAATEAGQLVQLNRMVKKLSPEARVMTLQKSVEALNAALSRKTGTQVELNKELVTTWTQTMNSGNETLIEQAEKNIYRDIAAQVPTDFLSKWDAWRYLCMLGNPKTIIRNAAGNVFMMPLKAAKDKLGALMELGLDKQDRTKYLGSIYLTEEGREMLSYAKEGFEDVKDIALGVGKYEGKSESSKISEAIREKQSRLPGVLGKAQDLVDLAMNNEVFGDGFFLKHHYAVSFAEAARARGYTATDFRNGNVSESQVDSIRAYAIEQAQKATYRDVNAFSNFVRKMRFRGDNFGAKVGNWLIEGVIPFKATPANVLVRAAEYGPLGVMRAIGETLTNFSRRAKGGETISGGQIIEHLASGLTGTAVMGLGMLLKNLGIVQLTGAGDDDDDREGKQSWSVQIGDTSISLDWLAPASIPFFMGVNVAEAWNDPNNSAIDVISDTLGAMYEPMLEMSMLSGIQDVLDSMSYAESGDVEKILYAFFAQPFISHLSQGIPTLSGQTARLLDDNNEYTYTGDISGSVNKRFVKSLAKVAKKIPFVDWRQYDYVDEWGRTEGNGNVLERFFNNFVNPAYTSTVVVTDADEEIERLEVMTGEDCAPTRRSYSITVNGEKRQLSGEEYERYSKTYGEESLEMMSALMASSTYAELDDDGKVAALKDVLSLADEFGKHAALEDYTPKTDSKLYTLTKAGVPIAEAYAAKLYREELNDSDLKASTKTANFENWVSHRDWTQTQKDAVLEAYGGFTTTMRADSGKYDALSALIGEDNALRVVETLDGLSPESGAASVSETQKIEAIAEMNLTDGEKWDAFATYKDDWRIPYFENAELNPGVYAAYLRAIPEYRLTKTGTKSSTWNETTIWNWLRTTDYSYEVRQRIAKIALMSKPKEGNK